jgi:tRNA threonylcarbamoyladenosine biosynthesis protein TsaE
LISLTSRSVAETQDFGRRLAASLRPGDLVLLAGDLGAGKTTLVQGIGAGLGVDEPMTSPTFTLLRTYGEDPVVAHADVWRLDRRWELADLGLDELLDEGAIGLVEWGDAVADVIGRDAFLLRLERPGSDGDSVRLITLEARGEAVAARLEELAGQLAPAGER